MQRYRTRRLLIKGIRYNALVADTAIKRMIGLMFRERLAKNQCMLFVFPYEDAHSIWMYNMLFSIDAVWLNEEFRIIGIVENARPCKSMFSCKTYAPLEKSKYILEFTSGTVKSTRLTRNSILNPGLKA